MDKKPITPLVHGINDYVFAAVQIFAPPLLGINKEAQNLYKIAAVNLLTYNALTDQPLAIKPVIPYKIHYKIDCANVVGLALLTMSKPIRKDKRAMIFNIGFVALAALNVLLTDWDAK